ncbi:putative pyridine nucleotide-disulfide oxidoreductase RclA [Lactococcus lactis]|nr:putative pyridine nucleotide-disulfide oxidoreductase RclA [Lactococcus lactis]
MFNKFGSKVTILEPISTFLPKEDDDISREIFKDLKASGVEIHLGVKVEKITDSEVLRGAFQWQDFVATGRRPNITDLNLEKAGVELSESGYIKVDDDLKTSTEYLGTW